MGLRSEPAAAAPAAGKKQRLRRRGRSSGSGGGDAAAVHAGKKQRLRAAPTPPSGAPLLAAAPAAGMRRQSTRGRSSGSGGGEESEAPAAAVHAGRISSEDAAARHQNMRGGGVSERGELEKRSIRAWSDVYAGGAVEEEEERSIRRGWMDRAVV
uniref:Uncharacterized protein n=1 Tax=Oryza meridionalis TaxID=40149 RepID=A0A0E0E7B3_9ORYZ